MTLKTQEHRALVEALRRRTRFYISPSGGRGWLQQWVGLGYTGDYKQAVANGYMERASGFAKPRTMAWWRLTPKGAAIVAYWIGQGFNFETIEAQAGVPPQVIPDLIGEAA